MGTSNPEHAEWAFADLLALADEIGSRIENNDLPPQNEYGQYLIDQPTNERTALELDSGAVLDSHEWSTPE